MLRRYLTSHGWYSPKSQESPSTGLGQRAFELFALSGEGLEEVQVLLPIDSTIKGFHRRVREVIQTLSFRVFAEYRRRSSCRSQLDQVLEKEERL
jgi:hypothetical protein